MAIEIKPGLHPRNRHNTRYDFQALAESSPELKKYISINKYGDESIDFANPEAVKAVNRALLKFYYNIIYWDIPQNYLCPPIPGRADYIHQIADLLGSSNGGNIPLGPKIKVIDIGVGANCVYPLIAQSEYGWNFTGSDIDSLAIESAKKIITANHLSGSIELRHQESAQNIFKGVIGPKDFFDITISNPPFHSSLEEAQKSGEKKIKNLGIKKSKKTKVPLNFGGISNELWCTGGEVAFVTKMINESLEFQENVFWFSSLISKSSSLPFLYDELKKLNISHFKTIDMAQGQKKSRILAWTFFNQNKQKAWRDKINS